MRKLVFAKIAKSSDHSAHMTGINFIVLSKKKKTIGGLKNTKMFRAVSFKLR